MISITEPQQIAASLGCLVSDAQRRLGNTLELGLALDEPLIDLGVTPFLSRCIEGAISTLPILTHSVSWVDVET